jgi:signal recognition particle subunit SRP68
MHQEKTQTTISKVMIMSADKIFKNCFTVAVLQIIKAAQGEHGMRHSEYDRYRAYCSRRLHRIRKSLKFLHGKGKFTKKELDVNNVKDPRFLLLPLFQAERSWSYAMELKQVCVDLEDEEGGPRKHSMSRLRKADHWAQILKKLCEDLADDRTGLEAQAYALWIRGNLNMEREHWREAIEVFMESQTINNGLAQVGSAAQKDMFRSRSEEMAPAIRFCEHNLKRSSGDDGDISDLIEMGKVEGMDDMMKAKLDAVLADTLRKQAEELTEVEFNEQHIPIRAEKVRVAILQTQEAELELDRADGYDARLEAFDKLFLSYNDAVGAIAKEQQELARKRFGKSDDKEKELLLLERYVNTVKTQRTMERNELIVTDLQHKLQTQEGGNTSHTKKAVKPDELVQMYGRLIQNLEDLEALDETEEYSESRKMILANSLTFKAFRCFYLAMVFVARKKWPEAVALYERSSNLARAAVEQHQQCDKQDTERIQMASDLVKRVRGQRCLVQAGAFLEESRLKGETSAGKVKGAPLLDRINEWSAEHDTDMIIEFPPAFEPVACKPIFFDLAFNYITFPDMSEHMKKKNSSVIGKLGGFFGFGK